MRSIALAVIALVVASGCGGGAPSGPAGGGAPAANTEPASKIVFWHAMTAAINGPALEKVVADFNKSQSKIQVEAIFQGSYDDLLAKLNTALASNSAPALVQVYDIGQRYMIDSGEIVPVHGFIDRDKFDTSDFEPAVINYYKFQDRLPSMPWNASSAILFYNKDAFKAAGLDPEKPPVTFTQVADAAKKLTKKDASRQTVQYGFRPSIHRLLFQPLPAPSGFAFA